jgi:hypothetical protein
LLTFYRTTVSNGVIPFLRPHPRSGVSTLVKFEAEPDLKSIGPIYRVVTMTLRTLM